jgi:hypothetical protein
MRGSWKGILSEVESAFSEQPIFWLHVASTGMQLLPGRVKLEAFGRAQHVLCTPKAAAAVVVSRVTWKV